MRLIYVEKRYSIEDSAREDTGIQTAAVGKGPKVLSCIPVRECSD